MNHRQCYVIGLRVNRTEPFDIIEEMSETPKKFGPHITLKGRFACRPEIEIEMLKEVISPLIRRFPIVYLSPWRHIDSSLVWRECLPKNKGFIEIKDLHISLTEILKKFNIIDLTPQAFQGHQYRPHLTVRWEKEKIIYPDRRSGKFACFATDMRLAIYTYEKDPFSSGVDCILV